MKNNKIKAFSLLELAVVILIVGILVSGIAYGEKLIYNSRLVGAQSETINSPLNSI
jgi:prepilin-type N-terminal cleavage/methylation domain-containing protein